MTSTTMAAQLLQGFHHGIPHYDDAQSYLMLTRRCWTFRGRNHTRRGWVCLCCFIAAIVTNTQFIWNNLAHDSGMQLYKQEHVFKMQHTLQKRFCTCGTTWPDSYFFCHNVWKHIYVFVLLLWRAEKYEDVEKYVMQLPNTDALELNKEKLLKGVGKRISIIFDF